MNRREIIQSMGLVTTHALFPSLLSGFVTACAAEGNDDSAYKPTFFTRQEFETIAEMIELIIPTTQSASAAQVNAHHFMDEVFAKCMTSPQQSLIKEGLSLFMDGFNGSTAKYDLLSGLDQRAFSGDVSSLWFIPVKQYAMIGFFTSEEGTTRASNYVPVPGDYIGEVPVDESTLNYGLTYLHYYV